MAAPRGLPHAFVPTAEASASPTPSRNRHGRVRLEREHDARTGSPNAGNAGLTTEAATTAGGTITVPGTMNSATVGGNSTSLQQNAQGEGADGTPSVSQSSGGDRGASLANPALLALHAHLAASLLQPACADIRFRAFGRIYSLHRVLLIQASFFHDLLSGDFSEAKSKRGVWRGQVSADVSLSDTSDCIDLFFDDCNITRPAFEYCVATLYGAAPALVLPAWASPTPLHPLTEFFDPEELGSSTPLSESGSSFPGETVASGAQHATSSCERKPNHPATPRFLLSLLATSTYLGIPSIVSEAVTLITCSLTPFTVSHYLNFALGAGIFGAVEAKERRESGSCEVWDWELEGPAWGLASLSTQDFSYTSDTDDDSFVRQTRKLHIEEDRTESPLSDGSVPSDQGTKLSSATEQGSKCMREASSAQEKGGVLQDMSSSPAAGNASKDRRPQFYYGTQSDRIGQVCSCWLLRWGTDILLAEEQINRGSHEDHLDAQILAEIAPYGQLPVHHAMTEDDFPINVARLLKPPPAAVWCHPHLRGIPARTMRDIISNDGFWIRTEWDRFEVARRVVAMRRSFADHLAELQEQDTALPTSEADKSSPDLRPSSPKTTSPYSSLSSSFLTKTRNLSMRMPYDDEEDEQEYLRLFSEGIYYTHMSFAELSAISNQLCPSTGLPYAPGNVLQGALWSQSELRNLIVSFNNSPKTQMTALANVHAKDANDEQRGDPDVADADRVAKADAESDATQGLDLGLTSVQEDFAKTFASAGKRGRVSRAHLGEDGRPLSLGGVTPSMQLGSVSNALEGILARRFYAVSVDDTVRVGENLFCLANGAQETHVQSTLPIAAGASDAPSGIASCHDPKTLPISSDTKRGVADSFFGLRNAVKRGKDLGRERSRTGDHNATGRGSQEDDADSRPMGVGMTTGFGSSDIPYTEWTGYEPMRMGLEFYGVDRLMEKQRMYSPSFFYAGSVWNLYVQTVKKPKGLQLGIYLHRQNHNDTLPAPSMPLRANSIHPTGEASLFHTNMDNASGQPTPTRGGGPAPSTPQHRSAGAAQMQSSGSVFYTNSPVLRDGRSGMQNTPTRGSSLRGVPAQRFALSPSPSSTALNETAAQRSVPGTVGSPVNTSVATPAGIGPHNDVAGGGLASAASAHAGQGRGELAGGVGLPSNGAQALAVPYLDQRRVLHAYFSIYCPSPTGTCMTKFSSEPDNFSLSQSWGWKSSSLLGHVFLEDQRLGSAKSHVAETFRCIVTIGLV